MRQLVLFFLLLATLGLPRYGLAQPNLEDPIDLQFLPSGYGVTSVVSDGYGQHILAVTAGNDQKYYLIGNDASIIYGPVDFDYDDATASFFQSAITTFEDKVAVVLRGTNEVHLHQSTDGGQTWSAEPHVYPTGVAINRVDAAADENSVYIVWDEVNNPEVQYVEFDEQEEDFVNPQLVTDITGVTGFGPKVAKIGNRVVVSFIRSDTNPDIAVSRDRVLDPTPYWESSLNEAETSDDDGMGNQSMAVFENAIHMIVVENGGGGLAGDDDIFASDRTTGDWSTLDNFAHFNVTNEPTNHGRRIATNGATLFSANLTTVSSLNEIHLWEYDSENGWDSYDVVQSGTSDDQERPTLSASRTGAYVFWREADFSSRTMRRKVITLSGDIDDNMFWTGYNWIDDRTDVNDPAYVTMKSGSFTTVLEDVWVLVNSGASLVCESGGDSHCEEGAEIICDGGYYEPCPGHTFGGPGACIAVKNGGTLKIPDGVTLTVDNGGVLWSQSGTGNPGTIELGTNSKIVIDSDGILRWDENANLIFGTNAKIEVHGIVDVADNKTITLPRTSTFLVYGGADFEMGQNAKLTVNGKVQAIGTSTNVIDFMKSGSSNWGGINVRNTVGYDKADATFEYCSFSGVSVPFKVETPVKFTLKNSTLTSPATGVQILPDQAQGPGFPTHPINIL